MLYVYGSTTKVIKRASLMARHSPGKTGHFSARHATMRCNLDYQTSRPVYHHLLNVGYMIVQTSCVAYGSCTKFVRVDRSKERMIGRPSTTESHESKFVLFLEEMGQALGAPWWVQCGPPPQETFLRLRYKTQSRTDRRNAAMAVPYMAPAGCRCAGLHRSAFSRV
jgi:hypothetical protein